MLQGQFERLLDLPAASLRDGVGGAVVEQRLMILDAGDAPAMHQTTAVQAKEVLCRQFLFQACQGASHRELSVRMPDDAAWTVGFYSVQFVGMQNVNVSVRVSEAELAGAGSLGIEVLVQFLWKKF